MFHDALVHPETVALAVERGEDRGRQALRQAFDGPAIHQQAAGRCGAQARVVVRLKGGDPLLFGRAQEEIAALEAAGIRCEVVPGITAALAAAAEVKTSLTQRGIARSVTFATPRVGTQEQPSNWADGLAATDAGAIYMGVGEAPQIAATLLAAGKPATLPVAIVENASLPNVRIRYMTLRDLARVAETQITGPALILLGPQFTARAQIEQSADAERCRTHIAQGGGLTAPAARSETKPPRAAFLGTYI